MGLCSFLLIGHWWEEEANARAAVKAFLTVRVGDVGMLVGTAIMFGASGTFTHHRACTTWANDPATGHTRAVVGRGCAVHRCHRQERPVPAAHLAARRNGRPDAGECAAALVDHGRGRRVPGGPPVPGVPRRAR